MTEKGLSSCQCNRQPEVAASYEVVTVDLFIKVGPGWWAREAQAQLSCDFQKGVTRATTEVNNAHCAFNE